MMFWNGHEGIIDEHCERKYGLQGMLIHLWLKRRAVYALFFKNPQLYLEQRSYKSFT